MLGSGYPLNDYYLGGSQVNSYYCDCPPHSHDEGGCSDWDVSVFNAWTNVTIGGDAIAGCVRQNPWQVCQPSTFTRSRRSWTRTAR